jgi:hypothetical protein
MAESGQTLATLDNLRWLDTVGYHTWRTIHHLQGGQEAETCHEQISEIRSEAPDA